MDAEEDLLAEQRSYYRARAPEYDEWWQRRGRYDRGEEDTDEWNRQVSTIESALAAFGPTGDVLELAGGTGWWTECLAETARSLTVVDASAETIERNRARVGRADVDYVQADLFAWEPDRTYDAVFFSFWLSHVPRARFTEFWSLVERCLAPDGRAFLIDSRNDPQAATIDGDPYVAPYDTDLHLRRLADGSEFRVVKVMYEPDELNELLAAEGWDAAIDATRWFIFGSAQPRPPSDR